MTGGKCKTEVVGGTRIWNIHFYNNNHFVCSACFISWWSSSSSLHYSSCLVLDCSSLLHLSCLFAHNTQFNLSTGSSMGMIWFYARLTFIFFRSGLVGKGASLKLLTIENSNLSTTADLIKLPMCRQANWIPDWVARSSLLLFKILYFLYPFSDTN